MKDKLTGINADIEALFIRLDALNTRLIQASIEQSLLTQMVEDLEKQINGVEDTDENKIS